jgi:hypothetical protein
MHICVVTGHTENQRNSITYQNKQWDTLKYDIQGSQSSDDKDPRLPVMYELRMSHKT